MFGIVLAAGRGARLDGCCKPLLKLQDGLLIHSPLDQLVALGCSTIVMVVSDTGIENVLGNRYQGCKLVYVNQSSPEGTAHALFAARHLIDTAFYLTYADLFLQEDLPPAFLDHKDLSKGLVLTQTLATNRLKHYAAVYTNHNGLIDLIDEKPKAPTTSVCELGFFRFPCEILDAPLKRGKRGEYELQSLENALISQGVPLYSVPYSGNWVNVNTPEDLARARALVAAQSDGQCERSGWS